MTNSNVDNVICGSQRILGAPLRGTARPSHRRTLQRTPISHSLLQWYLQCTVKFAVTLVLANCNAARSACTVISWHCCRFPTLKLLLLLSLYYHSGRVQLHIASLLISCVVLNCSVLNESVLSAFLSTANRLSSNS